MTNKKKAIKELKEVLDSLDITNKYRLNLIRAIEYLQEEPVSEEFEKKFISFVNATHDNNGSYSLHDFAQRLYNIAKEELKEPVSEDLKEAAKEHAVERFRTTRDEFLAEKCKWSFKAGAKWQKENLWKPADSDDLPEYEREVVVFTQNYPDDAGMMMVAIGHRPTPEGYDGKSLATGKVEHYTPKTYGKGGWNIPDVKYWLDVELPKEIEL